ncbi:hypothetical protein ACIBCN_43750 [Nocardia sp. NPDC051052]|uniref:hypothetical protein n=1 Tax=Nocardia sp. NPDC051052 TaxID=3364322 RepID=UPI003791416E
MSRLQHPVGTYGEISVKRQSTGSYRAATRFYFPSGPELVQAYAKTAEQAKSRLLEKLRDLKPQHRGASITVNTTLLELGTTLLSEMEADPDETEGNIEDYRREIFVSRDKRANPETIKIENSIGWMAIWQADSGQLDAHSRKIIARGN